MGVFDFLDNIGLGDVLQGAGAVASIFGSGKEKVNTTPTSGYATLPQYLKDAYEKVYFPKVMEQFNQPFQMEPTVRYQEQDPLFRSQAVSNYQALSDEVGGLFPKFKTPVMQQQEAQAAAQIPQTQNPQATKQALLAQTMERLRTDPNDMTPEAKQKRQRLHQLSIMKDMDGYQNEYTGGTLSLSDLLSGLNTGLDEQAISGYSGGLGGVFTPAAQKAWDMVNQETDDALRRPPERDLIGPLAVALMTGGVGLGANALAMPMMAGMGGAVSPVTASNLFSGAAALGRRK